MSLLIQQFLLVDDHVLLHCLPLHHHELLPILSHLARKALHWLLIVITRACRRDRFRPRCPWGALILGEILIAVDPSEPIAGVVAVTLELNVDVGVSLLIVLGKSSVSMHQKALIMLLLLQVMIP